MANCQKCNSILKEYEDTIYFMTSNYKGNYSCLCEACYIKLSGHNPNSLIVRLINSIKCFLNLHDWRLSKIKKNKCIYHCIKCGKKDIIKGE